MAEIEPNEDVSLQLDSDDHLTVYHVSPDSSQGSESEYQDAPTTCTNSQFLYNATSPNFDQDSLDIDLTEEIHDALDEG